jgi:hypothetical protein
MSDSPFHVILAGCFLAAGLVFALLPSAIAARVRRAGWADANRELFARITRAVPRAWASKAERLYERASLERSIRWFGFILLGGALLQLWAAAILNSRS